MAEISDKSTEVIINYLKTNPELIAELLSLSNSSPLGVRAKCTPKGLLKKKSVIPKVIFLNSDWRSHRIRALEKHKCSVLTMVH